MDRNLKLGLLITGITVLLAGCVPTSELPTNGQGKGTESGITPALILERGSTAPG